MVSFYLEGAYRGTSAGTRRPSKLRAGQKTRRSDSEGETHGRPKERIRTERREANRSAEATGRRPNRRSSGIPVQLGMQAQQPRQSLLWKGYKLHLDVTDNGIPVGAIVTGANVHDSQVAILERITEQRVNHLYSLMDSAYDAKTIRDFITDNGRIPIIDPNKRESNNGFFLLRETAVQDPFDRRAIQLPSEGLADTSEDHGQGDGEGVPCLMTGVLCLAAIKDSAVLHPAGHPENSITPQK